MTEIEKINVVAAIICRERMIFATQRGYGEFKDRWGFPGGIVEIGETPKSALIREIKEELDAMIHVDELFQIVEYDYPTFHLSMKCYMCTVITELLLKEHKAAT